MLSSDRASDRSKRGRHLVAVVAMLFSALFVLAAAGHAHAADATKRPFELAIARSDQHCPDPTGASGRLHCHAGVHAHACCMLLTEPNTEAVVASETWQVPPELRPAEHLTAPASRPPI